MAACMIIGSILFIIFIGLMAYFIPLLYHPERVDNRTPSQKILDHFEMKEEHIDMNEFIQFCKDNPTQYIIKNTSNNDADVNDSEVQI